MKVKAGQCSCGNSNEQLLSACTRIVYLRAVAVLQLVLQLMFRRKQCAWNQAGCSEQQPPKMNVEFCEYICMYPGASAKVTGRVVARTWV
jgi:hypothetical protein